jgi:hypothetical protein
LIFFPFIGEVNLFDWDETLHASISKEMVQSGHFWTPYLNGKYFLEKPPFFYWLQIISYKYLALKEYGARFPNAVCGLLSVLLLFKLGKRFFSKFFGIVWAMLYLSLFLAQLFHKTALLEPWFNFFVFLSLYNMSRVIEMRQERIDGLYRKSDVARSLFWSAFACVGAILTKGPEAYFIVVFSYWFLFLASSAKYGLGYTNIVKWTFWVLFFVGVWGFLTYRETGSFEYFMQFLQYQKNDLSIEKASFLKRVFFHVIVLMVGCFPASIFALNSLRPQTYEPSLQKIFRLMMVGCLIVVLIIATFVKQKVVYYSSLAYLPISFLATYSIRYIFEESKKIHYFNLFLLFLIGAFWSLVIAFVPYMKGNIGLLHQFIQDKNLQIVFLKNFEWHQWELYFGVIYFSVFLLSILLMLFKKYKAGIIILFFATMYISQLVITYYLPKIEQYTQGAYIDFVKQKSNENACFLVYNTTSYVPNFYSNNTCAISNRFEKDSMKYYRKAIQSIYVVARGKEEVDTLNRIKDIKKLYNQGNYTFFKIKQKSKK